MEFLIFLKVVLLDPSLHILFLMTGSALTLALKLMMRHDELKNVKHGVLRGALVEVWGTQILFHSIRLKKKVFINMCNTNLYVHYLPRYQGA